MVTSQESGRRRAFGQGGTSVQLAGHPDLTVCVITCDDGTQELEILHTGPPCHTEDTIDRRRFSRRPARTPARTLSIASQAGLQDAINLIHGMLLDAMVEAVTTCPF